VLAALISVSHYGSFWLVAGLLLTGLRWPLGRTSLFPWIAGAFGLLVHALLWTDMTIYGLFRYHINGAVLNIFAGAMGDSVRLGAQTAAEIALIFGGLAAIQAGYFLRLDKMLRRLRAPLSRKIRASAAIMVLAAVSVDKCLYAWGDLFNRTDFLKYARLFPLYVPLTVKDFAVKNLHFKLEREGNFSFAPESSLLNYAVPANPSCQPPASPPNILVIVLDSWRFDMIGPEITPNISNFAAANSYFTNHWSGGNSTRWGIFPLLYGIHATYWQQFLAERRGPALIDVLKGLGYSFKVVSSTHLTWPEFRRTAFVSIPGAISDDLGGDRPAYRDGRQPSVLFRFLDSEKPAGAPFFAFMYMDCPHSPYDFGSGFSKFKPVAEYINYMDVKDVWDERHVNRYKNGIYYDDHVVGQLLAGLEKRGLLENTAVFITGDHGEEFWESGYWGHTNAFTQQQCRVPMVVRFPGRGPSKISEVTLHNDVPATIFDLVGCLSLIPELTQGKSLLRPGPRDHWVVTGWHSCAIYSGGHAITYNTDFQRSPELLVRDMKYKPLPAKQMKDELRKSRAVLRKVLEEQRRFLK